jgi:ketosteroid isomerase-like protein
MERGDVQRWLDAYVEAWKSYDRAQIAELFSDDVVYRYHPYDEPIHGRDAVVGSWLDETDLEGNWARDAEGTYDARYGPVAVDDDVAVATGSSVYYTEPGGSVEKIYDNCFVMRFDAEGRCREFTEWFMLRPDA